MTNILDFAAAVVVERLRSAMKTTTVKGATTDGGDFGRSVGACLFAFIARAGQDDDGLDRPTHGDCCVVTCRALWSLVNPLTSGACN